MSIVDLSGLVWRKSSRSSAEGDNADCIEIAWRKSSRSTADGSNGDCVEIGWHKSSRSTASGSNGNCVEVAFTGLAVAVRDSKNPGAAILSFPVTSFAAFLQAR